MKASRNLEFDILRTLVIISAIIIHFHQRFDLGLLAAPSMFIQKNIFNVGSFFFFTSGYMTYKIYLPRFLKSSQETTEKILKKGVEILFIYILYITFMRLATGDSILFEPYPFLFEHKFFTKVLFTFSILFLISPIVLILYAKSKQLFWSSFLFLIIIYWTVTYLSIPEGLIDSQLSGVFLGVGANRLHYPVLPALIVFCIGFFIASYDHYFTPRVEKQKALFFVPLVLFTLHSILAILSNRYEQLINIKIIEIFVSPILVFITLLVFRQILVIGPGKVKSMLVKPEFLLIGINTFVFYITSNLILGFLSLTEQNLLVTKLALFGFLFTLTYLITSWSFWSGFYQKESRVS